MKSEKTTTKNEIDDLMRNTYFTVWFDGNLANGRKASPEINKKFHSDETFRLSEYAKFKKYVAECSKHKLDYQIQIETFHAVDGNEFSEKDEHCDHILFKSMKY